MFNKSGNGKQTKKRKKEKHETKVLLTTIPEVKAKIHNQFYTDGSVALNGYLVDSRTGIRHDTDIKATAKAATVEQLPEKEQFLVGRLTKKYQEKTKSKVPIKLKNKPFSQAYESLTDEERSSLCPATWQAESTKTKGLAYFSNTMLPLLDSYGLEIDALDRNAILETIQKLAEENGNFAGNPLATAKKVAQHIKDFDYMYPKLCCLRPQYGLPEVVLHVPNQTKDVQAEQCKALPERVRIMLATILLRLIPNGLAIGGILMLTAMPRTAEACAPTFADIVFLGNYAVYGILWQSNGNVRIADLKSSAAYRVIVLPKYAVDALKMRINWLLSQGFTREEISQMPAVSAANDPTRMASPNDLSAFLRKLLSLLGFDGTYWEAVDVVMRSEPDLDNDKTPLQDPTAYVLRRNGCTMCCNVCGMDPDLVDALMGHARSRYCKTEWDRYIRRPDNWPRIAEHLEKVIYHPDHSANPAFLPIVVQPDTDYVSIVGNSCYQIEAPSNSEMDVEIQVDTLEAGDIIVLKTAGRGVEASSETLYLDQSEGNMPILGTIHERSYYEALSNQADAIDLDEFLPSKYKENRK